ncbi:MAG: hypothetical protein V7L20_02570 [Nostoc sp.]
MVNNLTILGHVEKLNQFAIRTLASPRLANAILLFLDYALSVAMPQALRLRPSLREAAPTTTLRTSSVQVRNDARTSLTLCSKRSYAAGFTQLRFVTRI